MKDLKLDGSTLDKSTLNELLGSLPSDYLDPDSGLNQIDIELSNSSALQVLDAGWTALEEETATAEVAEQALIALEAAEQAEAENLALPEEKDLFGDSFLDFHFDLGLDFPSEEVSFLPPEDRVWPPVISGDLDGKMKAVSHSTDEIKDVLDVPCSDILDYINNEEGNVPIEINSDDEEIDSLLIGF